MVRWIIQAYLYRCVCMQYIFVHGSTFKLEDRQEFFLIHWCIYVWWGYWKCIDFEQITWLEIRNKGIHSCTWNFICGSIKKWMRNIYSCLYMLFMQVSTHLCRRRGVITSFERSTWYFYNGRILLFNPFWVLKKTHTHFS